MTLARQYPAIGAQLFNGLSAAKGPQSVLSHRSFVASQRVRLARSGNGRPVSTTVGNFGPRAAVQTRAGLESPTKEYLLYFQEAIRRPAKSAELPTDGRIPNSSVSSGCSANAQ